MAVDSLGNEIGKLFVGGLHQMTTNDSMKAYFDKFGTVEESVVMMDSRTGRSRGFGYIKFKDNDAVESVLSKRLHIIDDKPVEAKKCNVNMKGKNRRTLKIFVGGIALEHDESVIRSFFSKHGTVTDVTLLSGQNKQRHRGFAFVGFDNEDVVKKLIEARYFVLDGKQVEVKAMEPPTTQRSIYSTGHVGMPPMHLNGRPAHGSLRGNQFAQLHTGEHVAANPAWPPWAPTASGNWDGGMANSGGVPTWPPSPPPSAWPGAGNGGGLVRASHHPGAAYPTQVGGQPPGSGAGAAGGGPHLHWPQPSDQRHQHQQFPSSVNGGWLPSSWPSAINHGGLPTPMARSDMGLRTTVQQPSAAVAQPRGKPPTSWDSFLYAPMPAGANGPENGPIGPTLAGGTGGAMHQLMENHWPHSAQTQQQQQQRQAQSQQPQQQQLSIAAAAGNPIYSVSMPGSNGPCNGAVNNAGAGQGDWTGGSQWSCASRDQHHQRGALANGFSGLDGASSEQLINSACSSALVGPNAAALGLTNVGSGAGPVSATPQPSWPPGPPPSGSVDPNTISLDELLYLPPNYGLSTSAVNNVFATGSTDWRSTSATGLLAQTGYHSASQQQQQQQQQQQHAYRC